MARGVPAVDHVPAANCCKPADGMGRLARVRRFLVILCLIANLSILLMPFDTTHAHVSSTADLSADVHSGHSHDFDPDHHGDAGEHVVDLQGSVSAQNPFQSKFWSAKFWSDFMPLACLVVLTYLVAPLCLTVFAPPLSDPKPASRHGYWRPPLRGPPAFSIR